MSNIKNRTLKEDIDSGADLTGFFYRSKVQITARGAFIYEVSEKPNGDGHFKVIPRDVPLSDCEEYKSVEIPYWQHRDDKRCSSTRSLEPNQ